MVARLLAPFLLATVAAVSQAGTDARPPARSEREWKEPITGMAFVRIAGDCYLMGSPESEAGRYEDELRHPTCVQDFWLGKHEVTNRQFALFVADRGYRTTGEQAGEGFGISAMGARDWGWKPGIDWRHPISPDEGIADKLEHPVAQVSWDDARAFAQWLTDRHGGAHVFRLPAEAEWEYACRSGTTTARYWGAEAERACEYASVADAAAAKVWPELSAHACLDGYATSAPVGRFEPNAWAIHDMLGNVWEWTEDAYSEYGEVPPVDEPGAEAQRLRVLRGGSWIYGPRHVRCAMRNVMAGNGRSGSTGFRLVRTPR